MLDNLLALLKAKRIDRFFGVIFASLNVVGVTIRTALVVNVGGNERYILLVTPLLDMLVFKMLYNMYMYTRSSGVMF